MGTFFFRNRPEIALLIRLLESQKKNSRLNLTILGCSKGAEVYSFMYAIRSARPDLTLNLNAVDIDEAVVAFAQKGTYSLKDHTSNQSTVLVAADDLTEQTFGDQGSSIFERISAPEVEALFDRDGDRVTVKPQFRSGITWQVGNAGDPELIGRLGPQDIVVANRFLCHMQPGEAELCLRNLSKLVMPGAYVFVSGVDLDVRTKVARGQGWLPVTELIREIHEGDPSLIEDWPLQYWGLEPFDATRPDWQLRYSSVFRIGVAATEINMPEREEVTQVPVHF